MTLPKGTLVQIKDGALPPHPDNTMRRQLINHGHLWLIDEPIKGIHNGDAGLGSRQWYWCKALSSGMIYDWNADEFEVAKEGDVNVE